MRYAIKVLLFLATMTSAGCRIGRGIEQWKCDNLGMCHFGITPSNDNNGMRAAAAQRPVDGFPPQGAWSQPLVPHCTQCQK